MSQEDRVRRMRELREESEQLLTGDGGLLDDGEIELLKLREERRAADAAWRQYRPPPAPTRPAQTDEILYRSAPAPEVRSADDTAAAWQQRFSDMLEAEREFLAKTFGGGMGEMLNEFHGEMKRLVDARIEVLRGEFKVQLAEHRTALAEKLLDTLNSMKSILAEHDRRALDGAPLSRAVN